jgi:hypothetical protein
VQALVLVQAPVLVWEPIPVSGSVRVQVRFLSREPIREERWILRWNPFRFSIRARLLELEPAVAADGWCSSIR